MKSAIPDHSQSKAVGRCILVMGDFSGFSKMLKDYSLFDFAERVRT